MAADPGERADIYPVRAAEFADLERALSDWSARNRRVAADLVEQGAKGQISNLVDALEQDDLSEAVDRWRAIHTMHTTWGMEVEPFYEHDAHAASWSGLRRTAAAMLAKGMDCMAQGGELTVGQGVGRQDVGSWSCGE